MGDKDDKKKKKKKKRKNTVDIASIETAAAFGPSDISETDAATPLAAPLAAQQTGPSDAALAAFSFPDKSRKNGHRRGWIIAVAVILVLALVLVLPRVLGLSRTVTANSAFTPYTVQSGDITVTLSGSGTLEPADSYTVTSLISGDIVSASFDEGDIVSKAQALYTVDSSDMGSSIQQAENSLSDSQYNYASTLKQLENLRLKAGGSGTVTTVNVSTGQTVQAGQTVAVIRDSDVMRMKVYFQRDAALSLSVGESADVTLDGSFETYQGTVSELGSLDQTLAGNVIAREVTIELTNPGALSPASTAYATVGGISAVQGGTLEYKYQENVIATTSATVSIINAHEGEHVAKNQVVITLQSDSIDQQIHSAQSAVESAQLSLDSQREKLADYTIVSPISGTIVEKDYKEGDTLKAGVALCTIYDLSHLTLTLNVDELDIKKVQTGQLVTVTAAAAEGREYTGTVTKVNIKGTTKNGVTSYPVTIEIDKADGLLPGMNVDAKITVSSLKNVLLVPVGAVQRGSFVLLKTNEENPKAVESGVPAGYSYTEVTLGPASDTDIVITAGLQAGDVVAVLDNTPTSYDYDMFARPRQTVSSADGGAASQTQPETAGAAG